MFEKKKKRLGKKLLNFYTNGVRVMYLVPTYQA